MASTGQLLRVLPAVLGDVRRWPAALRQARALVPTRWWRRRPFLPVPDRRWMAFRMTTAYGDPDAPIDREDLLTWLAWTDTVRPSDLDRVAPKSVPESTRRRGSLG